MCTSMGLCFTLNMIYISLKSVCFYFVFCVHELSLSRAKQKDKPTIGHKLHHDVRAAGVRPDKRQTACSGPNAESWLNERVHNVERQISGVPANAAKAVSACHVGD